MLVLAMNTLGVAAAAVLLVTRTHAFCGGEKKILIAMASFSTVIIAATLVVLYVVSSKYGNSICGVPEGQRFIGIIYGMHMTYQLVLMSLTLYERFKFYRQENTPLVVTVYQDGVISMLCIALASMVNCIGTVKLPLSYSRIFYCPQVVVHSVLASRILFDIRATSESQSVVVNRPIASKMVFVRPIQTPSCVDHLELWDIADL
ncbi:hypothetical protein DEU56DRAFT_389162 [Suillus clintonianus]|uniref:uncharacterized protein n=1 Tax=Suillus clintonianus TaxID=1904413 RepID=UPI001B887095|nr:uncharacterized protein DEU56DRAFT_389162 [Suillus clintonianus]KAG2135794.1 hypothetical protein DEU56DRAFT_389162 [Suillus clintonianus]